MTVSSWVTFQGPLEHSLCPFAAGVPSSCLPAFYPPTWTPRIPGLCVCPWPAGSCRLQTPRVSRTPPWDCGFRDRGPRASSDPARHGLTAQSQTQSWTQPRSHRAPRVVQSHTERLWLRCPRRAGAAGWVGQCGQGHITEVSPKKYLRPEGLSPCVPSQRLMAFL